MSLRRLEVRNTSTSSLLRWCTTGMTFCNSLDGQTRFFLINGDRKSLIYMLDVFLLKASMYGGFRIGMLVWWRVLPLRDISSRIPRARSLRRLQRYRRYRINEAGPTSAGSSSMFFAHGLSLRPLRESLWHH